MSSRPLWATQNLSSLKEKQTQAVMAHTFNPSTKKLEIGRDMTWQRQECKAKGAQGIQS